MSAGEVGRIVTWFVGPPIPPGVAGEDLCVS
jgi:hypothetical protein